MRGLEEGTQFLNYTLYGYDWLDNRFVAHTTFQAAEFLEDLGLSESALARFIRTAYGLLDLISFFTVGPDEVRAWTIRNGTNARKAAGKIHSDLERGFIRAEVIPYPVFVEHGSEQSVKEAGKLQVEGKEYVVSDGELICVRFNV